MNYQAVDGMPNYFIDLDNGMLMMMNGLGSMVPISQIEPGTFPPAKVIESDPTGRDAHAMGAKLDEGKPRMDLVLGGFARSLLEVAKVGTFGARKYADNSWIHVPNGVARYSDAGLRHRLYESMGEVNCPDSGLRHAAHEAWNALARLDLMIRAEEDE